MRNYLALAQKILDNGSDRVDRTRVGCRSLFGEQLRFDLSKGFPLLTTKRVFWRGVVAELLWFISGDTNSRTLEQQGVNIWRAWVKENGDLGPIYSKQWRAWACKDGGSIDQLQILQDSLRRDPHNRRMVVSAWNVEDLWDMGLPPCHFAFQCVVLEDKLNLVLSQRSADLLLGVPFNIASYALLTHMLAQATGLQVGELVINFGDVHLYHNHFDQIREQLKREPKPLPWLSLNPEVNSIFDFNLEDITLLEYNPWPPIKAEVAV